MPESEPTTPKVFISYSWTSDEHTVWVADLGERLMADGIDVVLDQWSLEDGQDVNAFMEQMVTDPTIKKVIIISDALYAAKADGRKGGVGTETQIISKKVYDSVEQTKFIPLLRERDADNNTCLPTFLASRKYIDWSDPSNDSEAYDALIRNIFERPKRKKPVLGKPPSHLFDEDVPSVSAAQKAKRLRDFVVNGRGNIAAAFDDFVSEFFANFEELRMEYTREEADTWCDRLRQNIDAAIGHRDTFVDVVYTIVSFLPPEQFVPMLETLLERLMSFQYRKTRTGHIFKCSEDNYHALCYEFSLYVIASLIKARRYGEIRTLIDHSFVVQTADDLISGSFTLLNTYATSLEQECGKSGNSQRLSVMADIVHDRANRPDIGFKEVLQADVALCLATRRWFPRTMVYGGSTGKLELFLRAMNEDGMTALQTVVNVGSPVEFFALVDSEALQKIFQSQVFWHGDVSLRCLGIEELRSRWIPNGS